jgi:predicted dehydrogenase
MPELQPLRVAVVGLHMGAAMLDALTSYSRACVVAICDRDESRLRAMAEQYGIHRTFLDFEQMLDGVELDGVCISTPNRLHVPMVRLALERGLHVMCEKPLALDTEEAQGLLHLARQKGVTHGVNFSN